MVVNLDSLLENNSEYEILDSLADPKVYVVGDYCSFKVVLKKDSGLVVFDPIEIGGGMPHYLGLDTVDLNKDGFHELILLIDHEFGRGGRNPSLTIKRSI